MINFRHELMRSLYLVSYEISAIALSPLEFWINLDDRTAPTSTFVNILKTHNFSALK